MWVDQLGPGLYWFDADKLERIGLNLLANAVKFTPRGRITVTLQAGIRLLVEDTGPGMGDEERPHIFDRFYQGRAASASSPG
ncbi:ATP-binding protein [Spirosoma validum]|uniref:ATP-binding protein n=1 Tax=Spirosoma validum TaxID=2771355 RepID=A0A927B1Y6_9BACT|nr:ATP-binding protein [Spirosoma validum]MBD2753915.1 ATP-binding protein [Spirosoma validum]